MKKILLGLWNGFEIIKRDCSPQIKYPMLFFNALSFAVVGFLFNLLYQNRVIPNNLCAGIMWVLSIAFLFTSMFCGFDMERFTNRKKVFGLVGTVILVTAVYFLIHFYNRAGAPWNSYGLFDDAAWDIFAAQMKCYKPDNFEIIFKDSTGGISRELLFHYYITLFFRIFGYNLTVFNLSLTILGYITVIFTTLSVRSASGKNILGISAGLLLMLWPAEFTQVYMGHRYAICGPCVAVSFYFTQRAFRKKKNQLLSAVLGGIFAAFALESAIMGKQYVWALTGTTILFVAFFALQKKLTELIKEKLATFFFFIIGFAVTASPIYAYIWTHSVDYTIRESSITKDFFRRLSSEGLIVVWEKITRIFDVLFAKYCVVRQFSSSFPMLTVSFAILLFSGIVIGLLHKRFLEVLLVAIPVAGNCIADCYDFRLLLALPYAVILMVETIGFLVDLIRKHVKKLRESVMVLVITLVVLVNPVRYLYTLALDPNAQHHLPHSLVATSRYLQQLEAGITEPDFKESRDELCDDFSNDKYDLLAATRFSYAHVHAFLGAKNARSILRLMGDFPYLSQKMERIQEEVIETLSDFTDGSDKDLVIAIETSEDVEFVINAMSKTGIGTEVYDRDIIDDIEICMYRIYIPCEDIAAFATKTIQNLS